MFNFIHIKSPFREKRLAFSSPAPAESLPHVAAGRSARRRRPAPDQAGPLQNPVIRQRQTHQAGIQHSRHVLTFNDDTESRAFAVQIQKIRINVHCSNPPTVFLIPNRRGSRVLQVAELVTHAPEHVRQRFINPFEGDRKLNAPGIPLAKTPSLSGSDFQ